MTLFGQPLFDSADFGKIKKTGKETGCFLADLFSRNAAVPVPVSITSIAELIEDTNRLKF